MIIDTSQQLHPVGYVNLNLYNKNGVLIDHREVRNLVTIAGTALILRNACSASSLTFPVAMGIGSGGATPTYITDTGLASQLATASTSSDNPNFTASFNAGVGTGAITEAGLFTATTGGVLLARTTFDTINKDANDVLTINWQITIL